MCASALCLWGFSSCSDAIIHLCNCNYAVVQQLTLDRKNEVQAQIAAATACMRSDGADLIRSSTMSIDSAASTNETMTTGPLDSISADSSKTREYGIPLLRALKRSPEILVCDACAAKNVWYAQKRHYHLERAEKCKAKLAKMEASSAVLEKGGDLPVVPGVPGADELLLQRAEDLKMLTMSERDAALYKIIDHNDELLNRHDTKYSGTELVVQRGDVFECLHDANGQLVSAYHTFMSSDGPVLYFVRKWRKSHGLPSYAIDQLHIPNACGNRFCAPACASTV